MNPSTNTSALPNPIRVESFNGSLSGRINISISSENSFGEQFYQLSEGDVPNLNQIENSTHIIISKPILCKPEPASPVIYSQEDLESKKDNGENEVQVSNLEFSVVFCTVCHNDQPLRARHCTQCKQCVAMFDHHCSFVGTCIGERNKLLFFWFISFQLAECWIGNAIIFMSIDQVEELEEWTKRNIKYVLLSTVSVLLALLISVLWSYHVYLAFSNLTTWESMRREKIPYLANAKSSPFSKGPCKNIGVFCKPHKTITQWALPPV